MRKDRFYYLVREYEEVKERLNELRAEHLRLKTQTELFKTLEEELMKEIKRANNSNNSSEAGHWQALIDDCFNKDKNRPSVEDMQAQEKILKENEKLITYYEKKMTAVRTLLGIREVELIDGLEKKSIMMGEGTGAVSHRLRHEDEKKPKQDDGGFCFTKL
ncbi:MAG: hypothetical protein PHQ96_03720 [Candidatus Omnitrophica bacterium]|nr:hypothetical protein [Candidatus Omnitrophota bacterium]